MRLLLAISTLDAGGAERVLTTLANSWQAQGHIVKLVTTHDGGRPSHYPLAPGVECSSVDSDMPKPLHQVLAVHRLRGTVREFDPDAVISFLNYTNILTLMACTGFTMPVIISERLDPRVVSIGATWGLLRRLTYPRAAHLVAQTETARREFKFLGLPTTVISNPVRLPDLSNQPERPPEAPLGPMIVGLGRLHWQKGFDTALRAFSVIAASHPDWTLVLLGEGPLRSELHALAHSLDLQDRVLMPGRVSDPESWLRNADAFVMSSRSEGFPNALCEAMACGLPIVVTDCPSGPAEIVEHERSGLLVPVDDTESLAAALDRVIAEEDLRTELGAAARDAMGRYSLERVLATWDSLLDSIGPGSDHGET